MAKDKVATIKGTFLIPTVSKNRRLYTKENIGKAVDRMNTRLVSNSELPLTMFPSHGQADTDNALMTIGRITKVNQEDDGSATFEADIADTTAGRDMAALLTPDNPYLKGVSIRGAWMAQPKTVEADDGKDAVTASDLDVFGIDWTGRPGVEGAGITDAQLAESSGVTAADLITESVDAEGFFDETEEEAVISPNQLIAEKLQEAVDLLSEAGDAPGDGSKPYGNTTYADPGYKADKKKRYPIDTAAHVRAAWAYINVAKNQSGYTPAQIARVKSKIKSAAKKFNINISEELEQLTDDIKDLLEAYASMSINNGAGSISTSGYTDDGGKLAPMARRIAMAAIIGLNALDPDEDGDIDLTMPDGTSDSSSSSQEAGTDGDDQMGSSTCSECGAMLPENALFCPTCANPVPNAESQVETPDIIEREAPVAEETQAEGADTNESVVTPETPVAPTSVTLTTEQFNAMLAAVAAKPPVVEAEVVAPVEVEVEIPLTAEAVAQLIADAKEEARVEAQTEALEAVRAAGIIPRRGLVAGQTAGQFSEPVETKIPTAKELSEMSEDALRANSYEAFSADPRWMPLLDRVDHAQSFRL